MNWAGWVACIIPSGILFCAGVKMWPFLEMGELPLGDFSPSKYGTDIYIFTTIANNGLSDIRIEAFSLQIKNKIHFLDIDQIGNNGDTNIFIKYGRCENDKHTYYILKHPDKANLTIKCTLIGEEIKEESVEAALIINISSLPFPLSKIPFLKQKIQKINLEKRNKPDYETTIL